MSNVTLFPGGDQTALPLGPHPVPEVVALLESLLARAQAGEIRALAVAYVKLGHCVSDQYAMSPTEGCGHDLMAGIGYLFNRYAADAWACATHHTPEKV